MPEQARIFYNFGLFENSQKNVARAEEYLLKAVTAEPDNYNFLYAMCTFYLEHNKKSKAAVYARLLMEKFPANNTGKELLQLSSQ
jgi:Tfp pilus assembly protein PilF